MDLGLVRWVCFTTQLPTGHGWCLQGDGEVLQLGHKLIEMKRARLLNLPQPAPGHAADTAAAAAPSPVKGEQLKEQQEPQTSQAHLRTHAAG
jgi:hypothetical protein